jgi:hypothetical protein
MPVSKPQDLPRGGGGRWPLCGAGFRSTQWGDLEVGYTETDAGDHTPLYKGLPGDVCPCPHYGYMFNVLIYEEPSEVLELNPAFALQYMMDHVEDMAARLANQ